MMFEPDMKALREKITMQMRSQNKEEQFREAKRNGTSDFSLIKEERRRNTSLYAVSFSEPCFETTFTRPKPF